MQAPFKLIFTIILFTCTNFIVIAQEGEQDEVKPTVENKKENTKDIKKENNVVIPSPVSLERQYKKDLKHYFSTNHVEPILIGPDEYLTLINKNTSVNSKGVAILLPDWQQGAVNPKAINFLHTALPKRGWTTISIQPDNKPSNFPSRALNISEQKKTNKTIIDDYKKKLSALINAVLIKSKEYPGIVIIVAQGNHGGMLIDIFDQQNTDQKGTTPNALILLSSYLLNSNELIDETNTAFAKKLA